MLPNKPRGSAGTSALGSRGDPNALTGPKIAGITISVSRVEEIIPPIISTAMRTAKPEARDCEYGRVLLGYLVFAVIVRSKDLKFRASSAAPSASTCYLAGLAEQRFYQRAFRQGAVAALRNYLFEDALHPSQVSDFRAYILKVGRGDNAR